MPGASFWPPVMQGLTFSAALERAKAGARIQRMKVYNDYASKDPMKLPPDANTMPVIMVQPGYDQTVNKPPYSILVTQGKAFTTRPHLVTFSNSDPFYLDPWFPSQEDIFAEDWATFEM